MAGEAIHRNILIDTLNGQFPSSIFILHLNRSVTIGEPSCV